MESKKVDFIEVESRKVDTRGQREEGKKGWGKVGQRVLNYTYTEEALLRHCTAGRLLTTVYCTIQKAGRKYFKIK